MPFDVPSMLGPFSVDEQGRLAPRDPNALPAFLFRWRGRVIRARMRGAEPQLGRLLLRSVLGRVPSSAGDDPATRPASFAVLHWLPRELPPGWRLSLLPDHRILLDAGADIALPITASGLVVELAGFLLTLAPYLDLLEGVGAFDSASAAGMANT